MEKELFEHPSTTLVSSKLEAKRFKENNPKLSEDSHTSKRYGQGLPPAFDKECKQPTQLGIFLDN